MAATFKQYRGFLLLLFMVVASVRSLSLCPRIPGFQEFFVCFRSSFFLLHSRVFLIPLLLVSYTRCTEISSRHCVPVPRDKTYRDADSNWTLVSPEELESALNTLKDHEQNENLKTYVQTRDALRKKIGQMTFMKALVKS